MANFVFIATSLDGYIARKDDSLDWLIGSGEGNPADYGYNEFIEKIDAIIMGSGTYKVVAKFDKWYYTKPVFVLSNRMKKSDLLPEAEDVVSGNPSDVIKELNKKGYKNIYVDGGKTIQSFLSKNLIDEMIISKLPVLIGSGIPLFGNLEKDLWFEHIETIAYPTGLVKSHYKKIVK